MSGLRWAGCVVGLTLLLGCGRVAVRPGDTGRTSVAEADVELRVKPVERTGAGLVLTYEVHNRSGQAVWLLDRLFESGPTGSLRLNPDKAYVELRDNAVLVSRMLLPIPDEALVEVPEVPAVTRVEPGRTVSRRAVLAVPLRQWLPYDQDSTKELSLESVRELRLRIGYLVDEPGTELNEARDSEGSPYKSPTYGKAVKTQKILHSGPLSVPVDGAR
jgi:hypothetical protein